MQIVDPCNIQYQTWQQAQELYPTDATVVCNDHRLTNELGFVDLSISASWAIIGLLIGTILFKKRIRAWVRYGVGIIAMTCIATSASFFFKYLQIWVPSRYYTLFADETLAALSFVAVVVVSMLVWYIYRSPTPDEYDNLIADVTRLTKDKTELEYQLRESGLQLRAAKLKVKQYEVVAKSNRIELEIDIGTEMPVYYNEWVQFPSANVGQAMVTAIAMNPESTVLHLMLEEGFAIDYHSHDWEQVIFCISGAITVYTRSGEKAVMEVLYPGRSIIIPNKVDHALFANTESQIFKMWIPKIPEQTRGTVNELRESVT